jgi:acyl-CoA dehydrogenase
MDFSLPERTVEMARRVDEFVREVVIPLESSAIEDGLPPDLLAEARRKAKDAGLWAPQLPTELGGQGLNFLEVCGVFEAAGQSLLGPLVLGCSAPDEGNAHVLARSGNDAQKAKYLEPLARADIRSTFAMTEPAPGAGSDPRMMRTVAKRDGDDWIIDGHKWFATGADGAAFAIVAAVTDPGGDVKNGCTLFLVDADTPGFEVVRRIPTMGGGTPGGHCELRFDACRVANEQILGGEGNGFQLMQARLGPARLTHCMRWLGVAGRALEIARNRAKEREAFGQPLAHHQSVQWMLADSATEIHASRLMTYEAATRIARGEQARRETSMCKVYVAETVGRVIDRAIQTCGSLGFSHELPLAHMSQEARAFRIYDGPSEVHRMVIARDLLRTREGES